MKPIHKFNGGLGATLCNSCSVIVSTGLTEDLYCEKCKQKNLLIETMEADEKDGLYKTNNMAQQNENNELYDLEDLRSEYESTYLAYALFAENADFMNFEQWLEKHKGLKIK